MPSSPRDRAEGLGPVLVSVESGLVSPGDTISRKAEVEVSSFEIGGRELELPDGLTYDVALTNTGEGILATGIVRGRAVVACDRCLEPTTLDIAAELSCYYLRELTDEEEDSDEDFGLIDESNGTVDLSAAIQGAVAMEIPFVILCRDDCRGLCPVCGANLNEGDCGCDLTPDPDFERQNPFAKLAGFTFADGTVLADHADELAAGDEGCDACDPEDLEDEDDALSDEEFELEWERLHGRGSEDPAE